MPPRYHWDVRLPAPDAPVGQLLEGFRHARDLLESKVTTLLASDLLHGLSIARRNLEMVLDSLAHAVMAHTMNRRIFYFNQAAEKITGYRREEVLGKDCHLVFTPRRFCGGYSLFC